MTNNNIHSFIHRGSSFCFSFLTYKMSNGLGFLSVLTLDSLTVCEG